MRRTRRPALLLAVVGTAILLAGGVALAAVIDGTDNADTLNGTDNADTINGYGGGDTISGRGGPDEINGGNGQDMIGGGGGGDTISGGDEPDEINGGDGQDAIEGNEGGDTIDGGADADDIRGNRGDDILKGSGGSDTIYGGVDGDEIDGGDGDDTIYGEEGQDVIVGRGGVDTVSGGDGDDIIRVADVPASRDVVNCGTGTDEVTADSLDEVETDCEGELRISTRTDTQISGYFKKQGLPRVDFDSKAYPNKGELKGGNPFSRETTSHTTVDGTPFSVTVNPNQRNIYLQSYTEEGHKDTLSTEDRQALRKAHAALREFLLKGAGDSSGLRNEDALVLRHLGFLGGSPGDIKFTDKTIHYNSPEKMKEKRDRHENSVAAFERHMTVGSDGELKLDKEGLAQETINSSDRYRLERAIENTNRRIRAGEIRASDVFPQANVQPKLAGQSSVQGGEDITAQAECVGDSGTYEYWWGTRTYYNSCEADLLANELAREAIYTGLLAPFTPYYIGVLAPTYFGLSALEVSDANAEAQLAGGGGIYIDEPYADAGDTLTGEDYSSGLLPQRISPQ